MTTNAQFGVPFCLLSWDQTQADIKINGLGDGLSPASDNGLKLPVCYCLRVFGVTTIDGIPTVSFIWVPGHAGHKLIVIT